MKSHHGTHIRKPSEAVSKMLAPETPTKLSDGDIITFGKSVGCRNEYVRPIVVRAELIYGPQESTYKPVTPVKQDTHVDLSDSPPSRSSSGRYGIYSQASSDNNSSSMSEDSDIEEISPSIPASGPNALPLQPRLPRKPEPEPSHFGRAIEALMRFLPPTNTSSTAQVTLPQIRPVVYTPSPDRDQSPNPAFNIINSYEPLSGPRSPEWLPRSLRWSTPPVERNRLQSPIFVSYCEHNPASESKQNEPRFEDITRSHSPMDLASPSPVTSPRCLDPDQSAPEVPSVIGAWPISRSSSPFSPVLKCCSPNLIEFPQESSPPPMQKAMSLDSICSEPLAQNNGKIEFPTATAEESRDSFNVSANNADDLSITGNSDNSEIKALQLSIKGLEVHHVSHCLMHTFILFSYTGRSIQTTNLQT